MIKAVLFDLDGTLLPMDQEVFVKTYFKALAKKLAPLGYDPQKLVDAIWTGTAAMVKNDGTKPNEDAFWVTFAGIFGEKVYGDKAVFEDFYRNEFDCAKEVCGYTELAAEAVKAVKEKGLRVALATNPIFPAIATQKRIAWAGLTPEEFELYTTYENSKYCKPNTEYYKAILEQMQLAPEECLMVGNDVAEDMVAATIGMNVYLLKDCIINKHEQDISGYPQGGFEELIAYIKELG